jgi:hypothetical protein
MPKKYLEFKKLVKLMEIKGINFLKIKSRWILILTLPKKNDGRIQNFVSELNGIGHSYKSISKDEL